MARRHWNVTLVPDGGAVRTVRVPFTLVIGLIVFLVSNLVLVAGSGLFYLKGWKSKQEARRMRTENSQLRNHLASTEGRIQDLERLLAENEQLEQQARLIAGLEPIDGETRRMGVGGPFLAASEISRLSDLSLDVSVKGQTRRLEELMRRSALQQQSYEETLQSLEARQEALARTPTIPPLRGDYAISSGFGVRSDPFTGERGVHNGLDLRAPNGTPVYATAAGEVVHSGRDGDFGICVRISHGNGIETVYCHLSTARVTVGDAVKRGDHIGAVGSTGRSTGSHLHYEVHVDGTPRNPAAYILSPTAVVD